MPALASLNGVAPSWAEIDLTLNINGGETVTGIDFKSLDYESAVARGEQRGPGGKLKKRTTGQVTDTASGEIYADGLRLLKIALASVAPKDSADRPQLSKVTFDIVVKHSVPGDDEIYCVKLLGCHLDKTAFKHAEGTDANAIGVDLNPIEIVEVINGQDTVLL